MNKPTDMNLTPLMQRGVLYGFISGSVTTVLIVLLATVLNFPPGPTALVVFLVAILALSLLLGASGGGGGLAVGEGQGNFNEEGGGDVPNPTEAGGTSRTPAAIGIIPSTKLEYVMYCLGLGIAAMVLIAILLN